MKKIDLESHYYTPQLKRRWAERTNYPLFHPETNHLEFNREFSLKHSYKIPHLFETLEEKAALMDALGFDAAVLSFSPGIELLDSAEAIEVAREANDWVGEAARRWQGRFYGFAALPVLDRDASIRELERCVRELGFVGRMPFSNYGELHLDDDYFFPLFEKAAELDVPIYLHPTHPVSGRLTGLGTQLLGSPFGYAIDASVTTMRLICKGIFDRWPNLKVILAHLGEGFPYVLKRMDGRISKYHDRAPAVNRELPGYYFRHNIYVTTSGQYSHEAFRCCRDVLGIDRIMLATDYPYEMMEDVNEFLRELEISENDLELVCSKNAQQLLKLG